MKYRGYEINQSKGHGKSVVGTKKTATMRVEDHGVSKAVIPGESYLMLKQYSFTVGNQASKELAIARCKGYIDAMVGEPGDPVAKKEKLGDNAATLTIADGHKAKPGDTVWSTLGDEFLLAYAGADKWVIKMRGENRSHLLEESTIPIALYPYDPTKSKEDEKQY